MKTVSATVRFNSSRFTTKQILHSRKLQKVYQFHLSAPQMKANKQTPLCIYRQTASFETMAIEPETVEGLVCFRRQN
jgi:hypothetical protein